MWTGSTLQFGSPEEMKGEANPRKTIKRLPTDTDQMCGEGIIIKYKINNM